MTPNQVKVGITDIITKMIGAGLSNQQNYPSFKQQGTKSEIGIVGAPDLSVSLKNVPYSEIYQSLDKAGAYHIRMIDGALVQMNYRFEKRTVIEHRLCVFPAPELVAYDNAPEIYENDELYGDIVGKGIVHVPIRFDFNADEKKHVDVHHPKAHLTLGQYPNCRIPMTAPLTPARFIKFVLRNFYNTAFNAAELDKIDSGFSFGETITKGERALSHFGC